MKNILSLILDFLKSHTILMFLFLTILLGTLLSFMHNNHLQKTKINPKFSKNTEYNNSSKLSNNNKTVNKIKNPHLKYASDNYISSGITGKTANLNKFINQNLYSKNFAAPLNSEKYNLKNIESNNNNKCPPYVVCPSTTGFASPINQPLNVFFPPPIVVIQGGKVGGIPLPSPPPVPVPELSSIIFGLIGLSGILGFSKKILFKQLRSCLVKVFPRNCHCEGFSP